ncbi:Zinc transporter 1 [Lamellibrachia satsuma]|nr:Zinc transporter 1 [Lamellibrachia satsuma]
MCNLSWIYIVVVSISNSPILAPVARAASPVGHVESAELTTWVYRSMWVGGWVGGYKWSCGQNFDMALSLPLFLSLPLSDILSMTLSLPAASSSQLNMRGVFLHVLGDALGSVIVIISALVIIFVDADWKYKVDPAMSMLMVTLIMSTTIPLLRESALILLQTVPTHLRIHDLRKKLLQVSGVIAVHEFHIWQLAGNRIIASAHIRCQNLADYMRIADEVKTFFHNEGIHSTTIQPEFIELEQIPLKAGIDCALECPDKLCYPNTCCGTKKNKDSKNTNLPPAEASNPPEDLCEDEHAQDSRGGGDSQAVTSSAIVLNLENV